MKLDLNKIDVVEFLNELGMMKVRRDGNEVTFSCPFGLHMKGGAISMQIGTTICHCFGCGFKGNALTFLQELENLTSIDAIKWLQERWDVDSKIPVDNFKNAIIKRLERSEKKRLFMSVPIDNQIPAIPPISILELDVRDVEWDMVWDYYSSDADPGPLGYMFDRGFTVGTLMDWCIGWDEIKQVFSIPYRDAYGNLIGFKGRALPGVIPKYTGIGNKAGKDDRYNFNTLDYADTLFAIDRFQGGHMIVCEGELNCIAMHQDGFINTIGISGQYLSERQLALIKKYASSVTLIFDEWDKQVRFAEELRPFIPVSVVMEHDKDPAEMTYSEKEELISGARSGILVK